MLNRLISKLISIIFKKIIVIQSKKWADRENEVIH